MNATSPGGGRRTSRWRPRLTFRARLTLTFTALVAIAGTLTVVVVTAFMRTIPTYAVPTIPTIAVQVPASAAVVPSPTSQTASTTSITLRTPDDILNTTLVVSLLALVLIVAAGALIAWLIAGRMLRPLKTINTAAQLAGSGSLDHRIGMDGPHDELRDLADTFDAMLERLSRSFSTTQRFAANASHELRTPLTTTQTMLEVALADPDIDATELRAVAGRVLETNRRGIEIVDALLDLAERDDGSMDGGDVDLVGVTQAALLEEQPSIDHSCLTLTCDLPASAMVRGDAVLVRQAVLNLIRNAVRHNVPDGSITVAGRLTGDAVVLTVENTGDLLTDALVASLAEPFVRGAGRVATGLAGGHGLGLAIVDSILRVHHGTLRLHPRPGGGLIAQIELPRSAGSASR